MSCLQGIPVHSVMAGLEPGAALSTGRDAGALATCCPAPVQALPELPLHQVPLSSGWTNGTRTQREVGVPWNSLGEAGDRPQEGTGTPGRKLLAVQVQPSFPPGDFGAFHVAISKQGVAWSRV